MEDFRLVDADFNGSMPQWASEDSLKKLHKMIDNDIRLKKKIDQKTLQLLGKIHTTSAQGNKTQKDILAILKKQAKSSDDISKQTDRTNKLLTQIAKNTNPNKPSKQQTTKTDVNVDVEFDTKELEKTYNDFVRLTGQTLKSFDTTLSKGLDNIRKIKNEVDVTVENNQGIKNEIDVTVEGNNNSNNFSRDAIQFNKQYAEQIIKHLTVIAKNTLSLGDDSSYKDLAEAIQQGRDTTNHEVVIDNGDSIDRIGRLLEENQTRTVRERFLDNKAIKGVNKFASGVGKVARGLEGVAGKLPVIGAIVTALTGITALVGAAADLAKKGAWDYQQEYKNLLISGFSFGVETIEDGIKMDGIKMRELLMSSNLTIEESMRLLDKNAKLVNYMGLESYSRSISKVADAENESGVKFVDQMMMSREQLAEMTTQYLATARHLGQVELLNSNKRTEAAQQYIKDAKMFGQVVGVGMDAITQSINELKKSNDWALATVGMDVESEEYRSMELLGSLGKALNMDNSTDTAIKDALTDSRGAGLMGTEEGQKFFTSLNMMNSDLAAKFNEAIIKTSKREMSTDELKGVMIELHEMAANTTISKDTADAMRMMDDGFKSGMPFLNAFKTLSPEALQKSLVGETDYDTSSAVAQKQSEAQNAITVAQNVWEHELLKGLDSDASRAVMEATLDITKTGADFAAQTPALLKSYIGIFIEKMNALIDSVGQILNALNPFADDPVESRNEKLVDDVMNDWNSFVYTDRKVQDELNSQLETMGVRSDGKQFQLGLDDFYQTEEEKHNNKVLDEHGLSVKAIEERLANSTSPEETKKALEDAMKMSMTTKIDRESRDEYSDLMEEYLNNNDESGQYESYLRSVLTTMENNSTASKSGVDEYEPSKNRKAPIVGVQLDKPTSSNASIDKSPEKKETHVEKPEPEKVNSPIKQQVELTKREQEKPHIEPKREEQKDISSTIKKIANDTVSKAEQNLQQPSIVKESVVKVSKEQDDAKRKEAEDRVLREQERLMQETAKRQEKEQPITDTKQQQTEQNQDQMYMVNLLSGISNELNTISKLLKDGITEQRIGNNKI